MTKVPARVTVVVRGVLFFAIVSQRSYIPQSNLVIPAFAAVAVAVVVAVDVSVAEAIAVAIALAIVSTVASVAVVLGSVLLLSLSLLSWCVVVVVRGQA